jgi:hypothetical protein
MTASGYSGRSRAFSPLLRSDFAQSPPATSRHGDLTDSFVLSDGSAVSPKIIEEVRHD